VRIDLHTHSNRSDGTDSPAALVERAAGLGMDVVALTDHDATDGWPEALMSGEQCGVQVVPGVEISCRHAGAGVHLLGYLFDPTYPPLTAELDAVLAGRDSRLPKIIERLQARGVDVTLDDVRRVAGPAAALGRPHVADALVDIGRVRTRDEAFDEYLAPGRPAYVDRYAADLITMIGLVAAAGGVSVVAHPWARQSRAVLTPAVLSELAAAGLCAVEVDHQDHDEATRAELGQVVDQLGLVRTGSSDYHGTGKVDHEIGCNTTDPKHLTRLLSAAAGAAATSGRTVPELALR
jgi:hypothetical protein